MITKVFWRREGFYTKDLNLEAYNNRVDLLNEKLENLGSPFIFWDNKPVFTCGKVNSIWNKDGVHFKPDEQVPYTKSLRGAAILCANNLSRYALLQFILHFYRSHVVVVVC